MNTLKLYDGTTGTTIDLFPTSLPGYQAIAGDGYQPDTPRPDVAYVSSPYSDGARPNASRAGNVFETIIADIQGTSVDDLFAKLGALHQLLHNARDYFEQPNARQPSYLSYKLDGMTNTAYAVIAGGTVDAPNDINESASVEQFRLSGVRLTIEREPYYRECAPVKRYLGLGSPYTPVIAPSPWGTKNVGYFGSIDIDGSTYPLTPGHVPALADLRITTPSGQNAFSSVVVAYRSNARFPTQIGGIGVYRGGVLEAESGLSVGGAVDATNPTTKSGGASVTFGAVGPGEVNTLAMYTGNATQLFGRYRVFARVRTTSTFAVSLQAASGLVASVGGSVLTANTITPAVAFANTNWTMADLGVIYGHLSARAVFTDYSSSPAQSLVSLLATEVSGSGLLEVDCLVVVPADEYFLTFSGAIASIPDSRISLRASTVEPAGFPYLARMLAENGTSDDALQGELYRQYMLAWEPLGIGTGQLYLPPGGGRLTYLLCFDNWASSYSSASVASLTLHRCARYFVARGAG